MTGIIVLSVCVCERKREKERLCAVSGVWKFKFIVAISQREKNKPEEVSRVNKKILKEFFSTFFIKSWGGAALETIPEM